MPFDALADSAHVHLFRLVELACVADTRSCCEMHTRASLPTQPLALQDNIFSVWRQLLARVASAPVALSYAEVQRIVVRDVRNGRKIILNLVTEPACKALPSRT